MSPHMRKINPKNILICGIIGVILFGNISHTKASGDTISGSSIISGISISSGIDLGLLNNKTVITPTSGGAGNGIISVLATNQKVVALTFDDGPNRRTTPRLLDILKKHHVKATFFVLGQNVPKNLDIVKRESLEGHDVGNHSYGHKRLTRLKPTQLQKELTATNQIIKQAIGRNPIIFRPPFGVINEKVLKEANMPAILRSVDTDDRRIRDTEKIIQTVLTQTKNGSIVLMHDIRPTTVDAIEPIILGLQKKGYTFVTVTELLQINSKNPHIMQQCKKQGQCKQF